DKPDDDVDRPTRAIAQQDIQRTEAPQRRQHGGGEPELDRPSTHGPSLERLPGEPTENLLRGNFGRPRHADRGSRVRGPTGRRPPPESKQVLPRPGPKPYRSHPGRSREYRQRESLPTTSSIDPGSHRRNVDHGRTSSQRGARNRGSIPGRGLVAGGRGGLRGRVWIQHLHGFEAAGDATEAGADESRSGDPGNLPAPPVEGPGT